MRTIWEIKSIIFKRLRKNAFIKIIYELLNIKYKMIFKNLVILYSFIFAFSYQSPFWFNNLAISVLPLAWALKKTSLSIILNKLSF